jgi:hypothetical protein
MDVAAFESVVAFVDGVAVVAEVSLRNEAASEIALDAFEPEEPFADESAVAAGEVVACEADVEMFADELAAAAASADVESAAFAGYVEVVAVVVTVAEPAVEFAAAVVDRSVEIEYFVGSFVVAGVVFAVVGDVAVDLAVGVESGSVVD